MGPTKQPTITGMALCPIEISRPCIKSAKRVGQNESWSNRTAQLLDLTTTPVRLDGEWAEQLVCRYNKTKCGPFRESGSPDTQTGSSYGLNKLWLYSCVDPHNISDFARPNAVIDGRIIHIRFVMNKALQKQVFLRETLFHATQPSKWTCLTHGYSIANDRLSNVCL